MVHLSISDDLLWLFDRMRNASSRNVLAVVPRRSRVLTTQIEFVLLKRKAAAEGKTIAIVSRRLVHARLGEMNRVSVFETVKEAGLTRWLAPGTSRFQMPDHQAFSAAMREHRSKAVPARNKRPVVQWLGLFLLFVYLLFLLSILIPRVVVTYVPVLDTDTLSISVTASLSIDRVSPVGELPLYRAVSSQTLSDAIDVNGQISVPVNKAEGMVEVTNQTADELLLSAGTGLYALNDARTAYQTSREIILPAGVGETAQVPIEAIAAGLSGNLPAESGLVFGSSLDDSASLALIGAVEGGTDEMLTGVSEEDVRVLEEEMIERFLESEEDALLLLQDGQIPIPESFTISNTEILGQSADIGQAADVLVMVQEVEYTCDYVTEADLMALAEQVYELENQTAADGLPPQMTYKVGAVTSGGEDTWEIQIDLEGRHYLLLDPEDVIKAIRLRSPEAARDILEQMSAEETPMKIDIVPPWFPLIPVFPFQITFQPHVLEGE